MRQNILNRVVVFGLAFVVVSVIQILFPHGSAYLARGGLSHAFNQVPLGHHLMWVLYAVLVLGFFMSLRAFMRGKLPLGRFVLSAIMTVLIGYGLYRAYQSHLPIVPAQQHVAQRNAQ